jgi:hypothetical protein
VHKRLTRLVVPILASEAVIALSVCLMYLKAGKTPLNPEGEQFLKFAFAIGLGISLVCVPLCRMIRRVWGTPVGLCVGLVVPIVTGWAWARVVSCYPWGTWWFSDWTSLDAWIDGWVLSIPGGIAGAVVGFLVAKRASAASTPSSRSK